MKTLKNTVFAGLTGSKPLKFQGFQGSGAIYFDMDGTIADLYGSCNWLEELRSESCAPYEKAAPLLKLQPLAKKLNELQRAGWRIGIVSWLSKEATENYDRAVTRAKLKWLKTHLRSVQWDEIHIVKYGTPKQTVVKEPNGILFDDEERNRNNWLGTAYDEKNIMNVLKAIA